MSDPTPQPLQQAHDDAADDCGQDALRNIYVRRVGEALNEDGEIVPLGAERAFARKRKPTATRKPLAPRQPTTARKRKDH